MNTNHHALNLKPKNIVVKMPNWLGDVVMATPILQDLKEHFKEAKLTALCETGVGPLIENDPHLDEVLLYQKPNGWIHRAEHHDVINPLQLGEYDLGILLTNSFTSAWWFWRGNVQERIGFKNGLRTYLLTTPVDVPKNKETIHQVLIYKKLLEPLGIKSSSTSPKLYLDDHDKDFAHSFFEAQGINKDDIVIGINPGAAYGSAKCWPPEKFKQLTEKLLKWPNAKIFYFGDRKGTETVDVICAAFSDRVINLAGKTSLRELISLIGSCQIFLSNDSGPMHIASALNIPLIALFGSTNPIKTGPYNGGEIVTKHAECSPCYLRQCPIDFRCMTKISAEEVYEKIKRLIEEN